MSIGHGSMETDVLIAAWMLVLLERHSFEAVPAQLGSLGAAVRSWGEAETLSTSLWRI